MNDIGFHDYLTNLKIYVRGSFISIVLDFYTISQCTSVTMYDNTDMHDYVLQQFGDMGVQNS